MSPYLAYLLTVLVSIAVQLVFLRWLHHRIRDDEIHRAFADEVATNHLPHIYDALRAIAGQQGITLDAPPVVRFIDLNERLREKRRRSPWSGSAPDRLVSLAVNLAPAHGLDPALVCAVIGQESSWNTWAIRYEPALFAKYVASLYVNNKVSATEAYARVEFRVIDARDEQVALEKRIHRSLRPWG